MKLFYVYFFYGEDIVFNYVWQFLQVVRDLGYLVEVVVFNFVNDGVGGVLLLSQFVMCVFFKKCLGCYLYELKEIFWNCCYVKCIGEFFDEVWFDILFVRDEVLNYFFVQVVEYCSVLLVVEVNVLVVEFWFYFDQYWYVLFVVNCIEVWKLWWVDKVMVVLRVLCDYFVQ